MRLNIKISAKLTLLALLTLPTALLGKNCLQTNLIIANGLTIPVGLKVGSDKNQASWASYWVKGVGFRGPGYEGYLSTVSYHNHEQQNTHVFYNRTTPYDTPPSPLIPRVQTTLTPGMTFVSVMYGYDTDGSRIFALMNGDGNTWHAAVDAFSDSENNGSENTYCTSDDYSLVGISYLLNTARIKDIILANYDYQSAVLIAPKVHIGMQNLTDTWMHLNQSRNNGGTYGVHSFHKGTDLGPYTYTFLDIYSLDLSTGDFICTADPSVHLYPNTYYLDMRSHNGTKYYGTWAFTFTASKVKGEVSTGQVSFMPSKTPEGDLTPEGVMVAGSSGKCIKGHTFTLTVQPKSGDL